MGSAREGTASGLGALHAASMSEVDTINPTILFIEVPLPSVPIRCSVHHLPAQKHRTAFLRVISVPRPRIQSSNVRADYFGEAFVVAACIIASNFSFQIGSFMPSASRTLSKNSFASLQN